MIPYSDDNIFQKIINKETPECIAILDKFPVAVGHSLLITKGRSSNLLSTSAEEAANLFQHLPRLCQAVMKATKADGITVIVNNGKASSQIVFQTHIHVIPRYDDDKLLCPKLTLENFKDFTSVLTKIKEVLDKNESN